jgi:type IV secretion system protein TrbI
MSTIETSTPPSLAIRAKPPSPKRLSRKVLLGACLVASAIIAFAVISGLSDEERRGGQAPTSVQAAAGPPEFIAGAASSYDAASLPFASDDSELAPPDDPLWSGERGPDVGGPSAPPLAAASRLSAPSAQDTAQASPLLFASREDDVDAGEDDEAYLPSRLRPPRSRYALQAGHVIPAALITGLNSDLPGQVIAQVTAPVYDSVTGEYLLIPQGARLIGAYDNAVRYGDRRILLSWTRLILPNGWSINLQEMRASDPAGASGLRDRTDNHWGRLGVAIGLSAIISVIANESEEDEDEEGASLGQSVGDAAAQQAAQTGSRIVERDLSVRPSLNVRPGAPVRVIVSRDIELRPYR